MAEKPRWIQIHEELSANAAGIGHDRVEAAACKRIAELEAENNSLREAAHAVLMQGDMTAGGDWNRADSILRRRVQVLRRLVARVTLEDVRGKAGGSDA